MENEHLEQLKKSENAVNIIDRILPLLPDYGVFHFAYYAKEVLLWSDKEIREIATNQHQIAHIALNQFQYINEKTKGYYYELNDKGREAKSKGGHFSYLKYLDEKKEIDTKRQERKDNADSYDLLNKKWQYKTKLLPYIVSVLALTVSIVSYFKPEKKPQDLQPMQQKIQLLQDRVQLLDSLSRADTLLKKGI